MAVSNYIQSVIDAAKGKPRSIDWYRKKIKEFGNPTANNLIKAGKQSGKPYFGRLNMFFYNPKWKDKLPYYDRFPLVLPLERYQGGFLGINFHYLPIPLRLALLEKLTGTFSNNQKFDESTILKVNYNNVRNVKSIEPTIHRYLAENVKSRFRRIDADEFTLATLLPVQQFKKASAGKVWADSRRK
tara:strand:- start:2472 stop:3029 length:558 start_codon:yes stop_codon:yes gene_type:complete